ncbi:uncharacterized protein BDZ99DRAFT_483133 [Mytilinidion resinicola]|uniref:Zinc-binding domain-containing protein n=1 Tax=Mytilinidion resinicola TaxID=574789 RepID=A0A6A6Y282_9PEZI|nr:uncharacterized protein BDZ99DRAFT_483133 [Mytilinidion resinicola]KAF2802114.1 hypothetical protein BDZ99DRAFT_483133 [Mytilinidion resinicola]
MGKSGRYFFRCFSNSSAGGLISGKGCRGRRLSETDLHSEYVNHVLLRATVPTALISVSSRIIDTLRRAFNKLYEDEESPDQIWITFIYVPDTDKDVYHHAEDLAKKWNYPDNGKLRYEYIFTWEIPEKYLIHKVSVETLIKRGLDMKGYLLNGALPRTSILRQEVVRKILDPSNGGYDIGLSLGFLARCFGARAPIRLYTIGGSRILISSTRMKNIVLGLRKLRRIWKENRISGVMHYAMSSWTVTLILRDTGEMSSDFKPNKIRSIQRWKMLSLGWAYHPYTSTLSYIIRATGALHGAGSSSGFGIGALIHVTSVSGPGTSSSSAGLLRLRPCFAFEVWPSKCGAVVPSRRAPRRSVAARKCRPLKIHLRVPILVPFSSNNSSHPSLLLRVYIGNLPAPTQHTILVPSKMARKKTSLMFPSLHQDVVNAVSDNITSTWFHKSDSDIDSNNDYSTHVMGRFICNNNTCSTEGWSSKMVATLIRGYPSNGYTAVMFNQRCKSCKQLGTLTIMLLPYKF